MIKKNRHKRFKSIFIAYIALIVIAFITNQMTVLLMEAMGEDIAVGWTAFVVTLLLNKDLFNGESIGKRMTNLHVVNATKGKEAEPWRCLVRNLLLIIAPIELIMLFVNSERRIGDFVAGTRVDVSIEEFNISNEPNRRLVIQRLVVLAGSFSVIFCGLLIVLRTLM